MVILFIYSRSFIIYSNLNLDGWFDLVYYLINLFFFDIPSFYYYINLRSSIIFCLFSGDIYISFFRYFSIKSKFSASFITVSELFCDEVIETLLILSALLLPIKSPVASAIFWIALSEAVLSAYVVDYWACSRNFWLYLPLKLLFIFSPIFSPYF